MLYAEKMCLKIFETFIDFWNLFEKKKTPLILNINIYNLVSNYNFRADFDYIGFIKLKLKELLVFFVR